MVIPIWQRRCCSPQKESDFLKVTQQGSRVLRLTRMSPDPQPRALPGAECQLTENALSHRLHPPAAIREWNVGRKLRWEDHGL